MPKYMTKPVSKSFLIEEADPNNNWTVGFRQLREGDYIELADLQGKRDVLYDASGNWQGYRIVSNDRRLQRKGIYRTMTMCDLLYQDGTLVFDSKNGSVREAMTEQQFNDRWDLLDTDTADIIVEKYNEVNLPEGELQATSQDSETPAESGSSTSKKRR
jgi:hypothetical protein